MKLGNKHVTTAAADTNQPVMSSANMLERLEVCSHGLAEWRRAWGVPESSVVLVGVYLLSHLPVVSWSGCPLGRCTGRCVSPAAWLRWTHSCSLWATFLHTHICVQTCEGCVEMIISWGCQLELPNPKTNPKETYQMGKRNYIKRKQSKKCKHEQTRKHKWT